MKFLSFLLLHATVLEPDLDLSLVETKRRGDLHATGSRQVAVEVELLLELGQLFVGEVGPAKVRRRLLADTDTAAVAESVHQLMVMMFRLVVQRSRVVGQQLASRCVTHEPNNSTGFDQSVDQLNRCLFAQTQQLIS